MTYRESTLEDFISSYRDTDVTFSKLHYLEKDTLDSGDLILLSNSLLDKYRSELESLINVVTLTTSEYNKYKYNPKLLSYDIYGTTEMWGTILDLNQLHSTTEFYINPVKLYQKGIMNYIDTILNLEKPFTDINTEEVES